MTLSQDQVVRFDRQLSLTEFERLLDSGNLYVKPHRTMNWWKVRRNGKTKTWKRDPARWEVPCKTGLKDCFTVSELTSMGFFGQPKD